MSLPSSSSLSGIDSFTHSSLFHSATTEQCVPVQSAPYLGHPFRVAGPEVDGQDA